ncbi:hypothetical protein FKM82_005826 [Ascaphus truei]
MLFLRGQMVPAQTECNLESQENSHNSTVVELSFVEEDPEQECVECPEPPAKKKKTTNDLRKQMVDMEAQKISIMDKMINQEEYNEEMEYYCTFVQCATGKDCRISSLRRCRNINLPFSTCSIICRVFSHVYSYIYMFVLFIFYTVLRCTLK